jgi:hypothetical protein
MNDSLVTDNSNIDRDHMGNRVEGVLASLEKVHNECYGIGGAEVEGEEQKGQIDELLDRCELVLDDISADGIMDRDDKLSTWRPVLGTVDEVIAADTERHSGRTTPVEDERPDPPPVVQVPPEALADVAAGEIYYIRRGDKVMGPISDVKIREGIWNGKVQSTDQLGTDKAGPWQVLSASEFSTCFKT